MRLGRREGFTKQLGRGHWIHPPPYWKAASTKVLPPKINFNLQRSLQENLKAYKRKNKTAFRTTLLGFFFLSVPWVQQQKISLKEALLSASELLSSLQKPLSCSMNILFFSHHVTDIYMMWSKILLVLVVAAIYNWKSYPELDPSYKRQDEKVLHVCLGLFWGLLFCKRAFNFCF